MTPVNLHVPNSMRIPYIDDKATVRHCKIVGTLGPASSSEAILTELIHAGLNIVRLNFSHGDHDMHLKNIELVRRISRESGYTVSILQDLQGPKIRCGKLINGQMQIEKNQKYKLEFGIDQSDKNIIPIDYQDLAKDVKIGQRVMMDDGLIILKITDKKGETIEVTADECGILKNRKGVNFPDSILSLPALTEKDSRDLLFGIANRVDFVALSFVQRAEDIIQAKDMIAALGADVPVIAKIEKISAVDSINEIAKAADGLMVARGDLGVEASVEKVPSFQSRIIAAAKEHMKPVIIATQMLESMIHNPRATLAEVTDVANGVLDGADCLMLSGEVAAGKYPVACVKQMASIIHAVEEWTLKSDGGPISETKAQKPMTGKWLDHEAIAIAACEAAETVKAKAIICLTLTGNIARVVSQWNPRVPIIAISPRQDVIQRLMMVWGVYGVRNPLFYDTDELLQDLPQLIKQMGIAQTNDTIVITAGIPINKMCATNMVKINRIP